MSDRIVNIANIFLDVVKEHRLILSLGHCRRVSCPTFFNYAGIQENLCYQYFQLSVLWLIVNVAVGTIVSALIL